MTHGDGLLLPPGHSAARTLVPVTAHDGHRRPGILFRRLTGGPVIEADATCRAESASAADAHASKRPWLILTLLFLLTVVMFVARQALSVMAPVLRGIFHLSNEQ